MTDHFKVIEFRKLFKICLNQLDNFQQIFGYPKTIFFTPQKTDVFKLKRYGQTLESPIGVAAGPHTQLAQNIVAAWLCGARYIELKTIQTLDELQITKPCIDMQDEGYNCEWSQELKIKESFDQYLNAWIIIHVLKHQFNWSNEMGLGTIFNMSVGYDLKGIQNENVQWFLDKMNNCEVEKKIKIKEIKNLYTQIDKIDIPNCISNNVTLSTMHGCPPEEIEKIGTYLLDEKKLHTTIKLNPTLLGEEKLNTILTQSGFSIKVPPTAFAHDLKYPEAIKIIRNLQQKGLEKKLHFGVKLTNTLESLNLKDHLPKNEKTVYLSGRALHPIAINLANKIQTEFAGKLYISFSAGVNEGNITEVISCGLVPATVCSDILKPGGYGLLKQYLTNLKNAFNEEKIDSIDDFIRQTGHSTDISKARLNNLKKYAFITLSHKNYKKDIFNDPTIKSQRPLPTFDCIDPPCTSVCPTNQDIPNYLHYTSENEIEIARKIILNTNPFPHSTGMVCDHPCQNKCTRINYDDPLKIRDVKRFIAERGLKKTDKIQQIQSNKKFKVAIIGAGPAGLSCAYYLANAGFETEVFELKDHSGGMIASCIPAFRIDKKAYLKDIERIRKSGVKIHYNYSVTKNVFEKLKSNFSYIFIGIGAQKSRKFSIEGICTDGVIDSLEFLQKIKEAKDVSIGENIAIIGGGNTAMDTARSALRLAGENGKVTILYRRTIKEMPADPEEIKAALKEGIEIRELVLPVKVNSKNNQINSLTCLKMQLEKSLPGERPNPIELPNSEFDLEFDTMIPAIGQDQNFDFADKNILKSEPGVYETKLINVFIGGDALRGPSTVINAIGDGRNVAELILNKSGINSKHHSIIRAESNYHQLMKKRMVKEWSLKTDEIETNTLNLFQNNSQTLTKTQAIDESSRCIKCDELCNICVTVCPNLANFSFKVSPEIYHLEKIQKEGNKYKILIDSEFKISQPYQILHIADWCNECGNCNTFCPTAGAPYKNKPHLYLSFEAFQKDDDSYFLDDNDKHTILLYRENGQLQTLKETSNGFIYNFDQSEVFLSKNFQIIDYTIINDTKEINLKKAVELKVILAGAKQLLIRHSSSSSGTKSFSQRIK